jgi:FtsP/CotA-like multicopper oxidase with cupredoxin domain
VNTSAINNSVIDTKKVIACSPSDNKNEPQDDHDMKMSVKKQFFATPEGMGEVLSNDNKRSAGFLQNGILSVDLEARDGMWFPETHEGKGIHVFAFAEKGKSLQLPGPQIRVPEGTTIKASIHNSLNAPLVLFGFYSRPAMQGDSVSIAPGETFETSFKTGAAGTYFYRAYASDSIDNGLPFFTDSQLYGAFIVDPVNTKPDPMERVVMIGIWNDTLNGPYEGEELVLNGMTWPYTERMTYQQDEKVNWKIINSSNQPHPMHLHGFFYNVTSKGTLYSDTIYQKENYRKEVTELLKPGETMSMQWIPERPGNWLFHCHTLVHITPGSFLREVSEMQMNESKNLQSHVRNSMGGLIMGLHVLPSGKKITNTENKKVKERQLTLIIKEKQNWYDTLMGNGFILLEGNQVSDNNVNVPGPPIILNRDEPVSIKVINRLKEATTIHWHGLEIESYFDGVSGWGNKGKLLAPMIQPGDSFVVHMKPPRVGTYIYHTHMHNSQLLKGMYGPMIVKDPGEKYDADKNRIFLIGQGGADVEDRIFFINGKKANDTMGLVANKTYRFRVINITALAPLFNVSLKHDSIPVNWKILAKDGADFPFNQQIIKPAFSQTISIGETLDFEFQPTEKGNYQFEVRGGNGTLRLTKPIRVSDKP